MRDCNLFPGMALSCKETFSLYYQEEDNPNSAKRGFNSMMEAPKVDSFKLIDRIASDEGRFTSNSEVIINTEIRSIPVTKKGVYFAFRDQGACLSLISIKIYYIACPRVMSGMAVFPETPTGQELTSFVTVDGTCVANASPDESLSSPKLICKGDGNWTLPSGGCRCNEGFEAVDNVCKPILGWKSTTNQYPRRSSSNFTFLTENLPKRNFTDLPLLPKRLPNDSLGKELPSSGRVHLPTTRKDGSLASKRDPSVKEYVWIAAVTAGILAVLGVVVLMVVVYLKR